MGFELPNGKTARNLQEQVKFLTEKLIELYGEIAEIGFKLEVVDELPDEGEAMTIYLVPSEDPEAGNYYTEYLWYDDAWEMIGTTAVDLSDYCTLSTNQTITGLKTTDKINFHREGQNITWGITANEYNGLTILRSDSGVVNFSSDTMSAMNLAPITGGTYDIGLNNRAYKDLYLSGTAYIGTNIQIGSSAFNSISLDSGALTLKSQTDQVKCGGTFRPISNNSGDLGTSSQNWKDLYLSGGTYFSFSGANDWYLYRESAYNLTLKFGTNTCYTFQDSAILPRTTADLGSSSYKWKDLYLSGKAYIPEIDYASGNLVIGNASYFTIIRGDSLLPSGNNNRNLGSSSFKWKDAYIAGNLTDGTNSVAVADIGKKLYRHVITINGSSPGTFSLSFSYINSRSTAAASALDLVSELSQYQWNSGEFYYQSQHRVAVITGWVNSDTQLAITHSGTSTSFLTPGTGASDFFDVVSPLN